MMYGQAITNDTQIGQPNKATALAEDMAEHLSQFPTKDTVQIISTIKKILYERLNSRMMDLQKEMEFLKNEMDYLNSPKNA